MFGFTRKKSEIEKLIDETGIEHAAERVGEIISQSLPDRQSAYLFILEELDGASMGNEASLRFANNSGISSNEYKGALSKSNLEDDDTPNEMLSSICIQLASNQPLMAEFRCKVDDFIMSTYSIGKYATKSLSDIVTKISHSGFIFGDITNDLGTACEDIMASDDHLIMAYGYARRAAAAAIYIQGLIGFDVFDHVCSIFKSLQLQTNHTVEFQEYAAKEALDFIKTYQPLVSSLFVKYLIHIATEYEIGDGQMIDQELFKTVTDIMYEGQQA
jgi:hypothetical protein